VHLVGFIVRRVLWKTIHYKNPFLHTKLQMPGYCVIRQYFIIGFMFTVISATSTHQPRLIR